jgi:hypothetical protein
MNTTTRIAGIAAGITLTLGSVVATAPSYAADHTGSTPAACAQQQKQVDKAEDALARVTAVFEHQQAKVAKAKHRSATADSAHERNAARHALQGAKHDRNDAKAAKKAQQQRLAKAQARLAACQADQPSEPTS